MWRWLPATLAVTNAHGRPSSLMPASSDGEPLQLTEWPVKKATAAPLVKGTADCPGGYESTGITVSAGWCNQNCGAGNCPANLCRCADAGKATQATKEEAGASDSKEDAPPPNKFAGFGQPGQECFAQCDKRAGNCPGFCAGPKWTGACCLRGATGKLSAPECINRGCEGNHCCVKDEPPPPNPRILGGWTDCGEFSGIPSVGTALSLSKRWGASKAPLPNCTREEEQALRFGDVTQAPLKAERGREPSYSYEWGTTAILPGRFGGEKIAPIYGSAANYKYFWLTFGGEDTDSRSWMETAEHDIQSAGANGAAFDIEGGVTPKDMNEWIGKMRKKHPAWTYVYVPQAGTLNMVGYDREDGPDFVAPMLYYSNYNSYPPMDVSKHGNIKSESVNALLKLKKAGWPASRTILTYQSFDAARVRVHGDGSLLPFLGNLLGNYSITVRVYGEDLVLQGPYAGVLGWPAQCASGDRRCWPDADKDNLVEVMKGAREYGVHFKGGQDLLKVADKAQMEAEADDDAPCPGHPHIRRKSPNCLP